MPPYAAVSQSSAPAEKGFSDLVPIELDDARWTRFVSGSAAAIPVHNPAWAALLAECYGFRAFALLLEKEERAVAGLPVVEVGRGRGRRWISLPFTDACPLLADDTAVRGRLAAGLDALRASHSVPVIEVRDELEGSNVYRESNAVLHTLALDRDPQAVFERFHQSQVQRGIRKAEQSGLELRRARSERDLTETFYRLHLQTRRRQGVPVQPRRFFRLLWQRLIEPGLGFVSLAYAGDTPVAGAVFLSWNGTTIYKYGASDSDHLKLRPNHLIFWDAIKQACESGSHMFDFGRTDLDNQGLRDFKSRWGATEVPLVYSTIADEPPSSSRLGRLGGVAGAVIRRSPSWVCRGLGELFYKYAA